MTRGSLARLQHFIIDECRVAIVSLKDFSSGYLPFALRYFSIPLLALPFFNEGDPAFVLDEINLITELGIKAPKKRRVITIIAPSC